jgi:hypothetical protein
VQLCLWFMKELVAFRPGRLRLRFEAYLANEVLAGNIDEKNLRGVLIYLLRVCSRINDKNSLDIVIYRHHDELPLQSLSDSTLARLAVHCQDLPYENHRQVFALVKSELNRRQTAIYL